MHSREVRITFKEFFFFAFGLVFVENRYKYFVAYIIVLQIYSES